MTFKLNVHYGGKFVLHPKKHYKGGKKYEVPGMEVDRWTFNVAKTILKEECHVQDMYSLWWYKPDDDTYNKIANNKDANQVSIYATKMNTDVQLFVEHSSKGIESNNGNYVEGGSSDEATGSDEEYVEGGSSNDTTESDSDYVAEGGEDESENESSDDNADGVAFDDSEDERALGLHDGFNVVLEEPNLSQKADVTCSQKRKKKPVSKVNTRKTANVFKAGSSGLDRDFKMDHNYDSGDLSSSDPDASDSENSPKYDKFNMDDLTASYNFKKGLEFASLEEFKLAITEWAVMNRRQHKYVKNDKGRVRVACKEDCGFLALVSKVGNKETYRMKQYVGPHKCRGSSKKTSASSKWISKTVTKMLATRDTVKLSEIISQIRSTYSVEITINKARKARQIAIEIVDGEVAKQYNLLWRYSEELRTRNKGNTARVNVIRIGSTLQPMFDSFYFCFDGIKKGFVSACRPFIGVDGWHLKTKYGGTLFIAVGRDPNDQYFPLAFGVCHTETTESWRWFMTLLLDDIGQDKKWVFISDHKNGLIQVLEDMFQGIEHRICLRHLYADFKKKFGGGIRFRELIMGAAKATYVQAWEAKMQELKSINVDAWDWLVRIPKNLWCKHAFSFHSKCDVLMNKLSEAFKDTILSARDKPILTMCEWIRKYLMNRNQTLSKKVDGWEHNICPNPKLRLQNEVEHSGSWVANSTGDNTFQVEHINNGHSYIVDTEQRICSCNFWELVGIPCRHAVAALGMISENPDDFVHEYYSKETYKRCYSFFVSPINGQDMWPDVEVEEMLPPAYERRPPRPKKRRRREPHPDPSKRRPRSTYNCTRCGGAKHNALSCTSVEVNPEAQKRKRKPKKNAIVKYQPRTNATASPPRQDPDSTASPPRQDPNTTAAPPRQDPNTTEAPPRQDPYTTASPPRQDPDTTAAPPEVQVDDDEVFDDVEYQMLAAELAAAFEATQSQPTVNAVTNETNGYAIVVANCNTSAPEVDDPDGIINSSADDFILSQPVSTVFPGSKVSASKSHRVQKSRKTTRKKVVKQFSADQVGASKTPEVVKPKKKTKKKPVQYDPTKLRRSDRMRTLRCKDIKGPGSDPNQPLNIDDGDDEADDESHSGMQFDGPSSQPNLHDPRIGGCLSALRGWGFNGGRSTQ